MPMKREFGFEFSWKNDIKTVGKKWLQKIFLARLPQPTGENHKKSYGKPQKNS